MKKLLLSLLLSMAATVALWADNSYFKVVSGSFESGDVTLEITICDAMRVEFEPMEQYASVALYNNGKNLGYAYVKDGKVSTDENKVTVHFTGFTPPADADVKKYYTFINNKNILLDGEIPTMAYYSYGLDYQPYAEVVGGSLDEGSLTVKVTVPYADEVSAPSSPSSKRVTLCYLDGTYKGSAISYTYMSNVIAYEGNTLTLPFTLDLGTKRNTLINWSIHFFPSALNMDARTSAAGIEVPFTDVCGHTDVYQYSHQEPEAYAGHRECLVCKACYQTFCTWDTQHVNPMPWKVFSLPAYDASCAHQHYTYGKCDACGRKCPHVNGIKLVTPECQGRYSQVYQCVDCAQYFLEENGRNSITEHAVTHIFADPDVKYDDYCHNGCGRISPAKCKHYSIEIHEAVESCDGPGYREYMECTDCGTLFDENGEVRPLEYFEAPSVGHQYNYFGVCSICGSEDVESGFWYDYCPEHDLQEIATSRRSCVDYSTGADFVRCNRCERYFCVRESGELQSVLKSAIPVTTPGDVFHGGHLVKLEATDAGCYEHGYARHQHCTACDARYGYYASEKACTWESRYSESYYENYIKKTAHNGHEFNGTAVCSRCGYEATYREVTREGELMNNAFYIIVSKIGDQYYAMGRPAPRVDEALWEHSGSNGYEAIPVEVNEDGTITVSNTKVAQLYAAANTTLRYYPKVEWETLYMFFDPVDDQIIAPFPNTPSAAGLSIADGLWNPDERVHMRLSIYDGKASLTHEDDPKKSHCYVDMNDFVDKGTLLYEHPYAADHTTVFTHAVYLGKNPGEAPRFHFGGWVYGRDSYHRADPEYDKHYPAHIYLIDTETHVKAEGSSAIARGRMSKRDVEELVNAADESYRQVTSVEGADVEAAKVTTIDLSAVTFGEDMTAADIESLKNAESISENVLVYVPGTTDIKGTNIVNNGECKNLVITDKANMSIESDFTAANASYERAMTHTPKGVRHLANAADSKWGTLTLPFAVESNDDVQLYQLEAVSYEDGTGVMTFKATESAEAGQPVVFRKKDVETNSIVLSATHAKLSAANADGINTNVADWTIKGTYKETSIQSGKTVEGSNDEVNRYYIAADQFWNAKVKATVPAFRAWFEAAESAAGVKAASFLIFVEDQEETRVLDIDAEGNLHECTGTYDLDGRKLASPIAGKVNIINGKKILVK